MGKKKSKSSNRPPFASLRLSDPIRPSPDSVASSTASSNGVANGNGTKHNASSPPAPSSSRSSSSMKKHLIHNIIFLIAGLGIGFYFGHEMCFTANHDVTKVTTDDVEETKKKGIFKTVLTKHRKKHNEITSHHNAAAQTTTAATATSASEEIDRVHPIRHILEGASVFHHAARERQKDKKAAATTSTIKTTTATEEEMEVDWKKWKFGMTDDFDLTSAETNIVKELEQRVLSKASSIRICPNNDNEECAENDKVIQSLSGGSTLPRKTFLDRVDSVPWGGYYDSDYTKWWPRQDSKDPNKMYGGMRILAGYLKIMKYQLHVKFPHKLCEEGCDSEVAVLHTLEWREKYKPWCLTPQTIEYNKNGFIYLRGNSRPGPRKRVEAANDSESLSTSGHSLLFYRPAATTVEHPNLYGRAILNAIDSAIADSLLRNKGEIGRFNIIFDCKGFGSKNAPSIANVKLLFRYLQDHFPDRLGVLVVANLGGMAQMLMKMVLPFVTEAVRAKIHIIPNDDEGRREMLLQFIEEDKIPTWLGGKDDYEFDSKEYYGDATCVLPDEEIIDKFLIDMPYHA